MKRMILFGIISLFAVLTFTSCNDNQSKKTDENKSLDEILIELKNEDPDEMATNKVINDLILKNGGGNVLNDAKPEYNNLEFRMSGLIGNDSSMLCLQFQQLNKELFITYHPSPYVFNDYKDVFANVSAKVDYYNIESGYLVISVCKEEALVAILKGYAHGDTAEATYDGTLYTKDGKEGFSFEDDAKLWGY